MPTTGTLCSSAGNDIFYDESQVEQGRNFCGKIWNAWRLVSGWSVDTLAEQPRHALVAIKWFDNLLSRTIDEVEDHYSKFRISDALMAIYKLFRDDFCSWYLEIVKPAYGGAIDGTTYEATCTFFDKLIKLIHPVMPFITEELWQAMEERREGETIMYQRTPKAGPYNAAFLESFSLAQEAVIAVRGLRVQKNIPPKQKLDLFIADDSLAELYPAISKLAIVDIHQGAPEGAAASFIVGTVKMAVPLAEFVNVEEERRKLEAELDYQRKFLAQVRGKLSNKGFVEHAPEAVVAVERKKEADALARIQAIETSLKALS